MKEDDPIITAIIKNTISGFLTIPNCDNKNITPAVIIKVIVITLYPPLFAFPPILRSIHIFLTFFVLSARKSSTVLVNFLGY